MIADTVRIEQRGSRWFSSRDGPRGRCVGPLIGYAARHVLLFAGNFTQIFLVASIPALLAVLVAIVFNARVAGSSHG